MASQAPRYRHRSKSAPRGRSPDPKTLKKEVKSRKEKGKPATARDPYVTPPTKRTSRSVESSAESKIKAFRPTKLTFGRNSVHEIEAQHPRGKKPGQKPVSPRPEEPSSEEEDQESDETPSLVKGKEEEDEEDEDEEDDEDEAEEGSDGEETGPGDSESEEETEEEPEETPEEKSTGKKRKREDEASSSKKSSEKAEEKTEAKGKKGLEKAEAPLKNDKSDKKKNRKHKKEKKEKKKAEKEEDKEEKEEGGEEEDGAKNSSTHRCEWQAFKRWINNKKKCPAKIIAACKNEETRNQIFNDYVELGRKNTSQVEARFNLTIQDPEFPDDEGELLYWVLVEFNLDDIKELKRITQLELQGSLDPEGVKAFVEAGGCLDGSQHLSLKDMAGKSGMKSLENATIGMKGKVKKPKGPKRTNGNTEDKEQDPNAKKVTADTPIEKAQALVNRILKDINSCREFAFKLRPLAMSTDLIDQLSACAVKLGRQAELLQQKIKSKQNKNRHYVDIIREVDEITAMAKGRLELAKALIRASEKSSKPKKKAAENPGDAATAKQPSA
ncbi:unnamed protein product [Durusdinium trenchii]|uniref:Uncharacterized protein n=1 Tax=Durusdinium trenchii TaxID=1381693 RepID=A0ABP0HP47_9DINO